MRWPSVPGSRACPFRIRTLKGLTKRDGQPHIWFCLPAPCKSPLGKSMPCLGGFNARAGFLMKSTQRCLCLLRPVIQRQAAPGRPCAGTPGAACKCRWNAQPVRSAPPGTSRTPTTHTWRGSKDGCGEWRADSSKQPARRPWSRLWGPALSPDEDLGSSPFTLLL